MTLINLHKFAVLAIVTAILAFQTMVVVTRESHWFWPFFDYPMYSSARFEGDRVQVSYDIYLRHADSSEVLFDAEELGWTMWFIKAYVVGPLANGNEDAIKPFLDSYRERLGKDIVGLRVVERFPVIVTRDGMREAPPRQTLMNLTIEPSTMEKRQ